MRQDTYKAFKAFAATEEAAALTGERARALKLSLRDSKRSGLELPEAKRKKVGSWKPSNGGLGLAPVQRLYCWGMHGPQLTFFIHACMLLLRPPP